METKQAESSFNVLWYTRIQWLAMFLKYFVGMIVSLYGSKTNKSVHHKSFENDLFLCVHLIQAFMLNTFSNKSLIKWQIMSCGITHQVHFLYKKCK